MFMLNAYNDGFFLNRYLKITLGQRLNVTLFDFETWTRHENNELTAHNHCDKYALIHDSTGEKHSICGDDHRIRNIYVSTSNKADIIMTSQNSKGRRFLMQYEGMNIMPCFPTIVILREFI